VAELLSEKNTKICFVCGVENPLGLHVPFTRDGEQGSRATYIVRSEHVGWPGLVHGGLLFTLMDESVAWLLYFNGLRGVTAKAETRFKRPAPVGASLVITGSIVKRARRLVQVRAEVQRADADNEIIADMEATMYLVDSVN
jgi:acyl-coenzyme A thioesterase PaaI-like protein